LSPSTEENRAAAEEDPNRFINTGWVYVPVVGSLMQIIQARSGLERGLGVLFFPLDVVTAGMAGSAVLKLSQAGIATLRGTAPAAIRELSEAGMRAVTEEAAKETVLQGMRAGRAVVATEGVLNHAVIYVMDEAGQIVRIHGGISRLLYGATSRSAEQFAMRMNTFRVVGEQGINFTLLEASEQLRQGGVWMLRSCGATQCLLLERAGLGSLVPASYTGRFIPASVMGHMALEGEVAVVNGVRMLTGTVIQESLLLSMGWAPGRLGTFNVMMATPEASASASEFRRSAGGATANATAGGVPTEAVRIAREVHERYGDDPQGMELDDLLVYAEHAATTMSREVRQNMLPAFALVGLDRFAAERFVRRLYGIR
jgi:hypothetical protein